MVLGCVIKAPNDEVVLAAIQRLRVLYPLALLKSLGSNGVYNFPWRRRLRMSFSNLIPLGLWTVSMGSVLMWISNLL